MKATLPVFGARHIRRAAQNLFLMSALATATAADSSTPAQPNAKQLALAREVLREVPLIDGHNDLPWQFRKLHNDLSAVDLRGDTSRLKDPWVTDIPRLRAGGVGGQFWAVYVPPTLPGAEAVHMTLEQLDLVHRLVACYADTFELALTTEAVERIHRRGKIASLIGIEGGHSIGNSLAVLRMEYQLGARYLTLTHTKNTAWADAAGDKPAHHGLTPFGEDVVRELNRLGMMVDLSHVSDDTMRAALRVSRAPVIFSHSSARAICDHERNVPDDILRETAQKRGLVMVCFLPGYVTNAARDEFRAAMAERERLAALYPNDTAKAETEMDKWRKAHPDSAVPTVRDVADHVDHLRKVMGVEHVGIGSDFDGFHGWVTGLEDVSKFPTLLAELARRGYSKDDLKKIAGLNLLRVMREVEAVAKQLEHEQAK
jgi:membrane dipeptidase